MTRKACEAIVHVGTICLSWRSIKTLKRESNRMNIEILQLWSLLALHKVYIRFGFESFISWFPFYYYFKMIILVVTFIPGANFPNFWFETILLPAIRNIHQFLNLDIDLDLHRYFDWINWTRTHAILFPFLLIDYIFIPGLLSYQEARIVTSPTMEPQMEQNQNQIIPLTPPKQQQQQQQQLSPMKKNISFKKSSKIAHTLLVQSRRNLRTFSRDHQYCNKNKMPKKSLQRDEQIIANSKGTISQSFTSDTTICTNSDSEPSIQSDNDTSMRIVSSIGGNIQINDMIYQDSTSQYTTKKITKLIKTDKMKRGHSNDHSDCDDDNDNEDEMSKRMVNPSRQSLSHNLRHLVTGDPNLRVRDHLFNLSIPSSPSPRKRKNDIHVKTRHINQNSNDVYDRRKESNLSFRVKKDKNNPIDIDAASTVPNFTENTQQVSDAIFLHMDKNVSTRRRRRSPRQIAKQSWQKRQSQKRFLSNEFKSTYESMS